MGVSLLHVVFPLSLPAFSICCTKLISMAIFFLFSKSEELFCVRLSVYLVFSGYSGLLPLNQVPSK